MNAGWRSIRRALRWCRNCQLTVATNERCSCPTPNDHVPVLIADALIGPQVQIGPFVHLYGCTVGEGTRVGAFVEMQRGVTVGPRCKIGSHSFLCTGVEIGDGVFVGHGVMFCNDRRPRAVRKDGTPIGTEDWMLEPVRVGHRASIGSGAIILPGISIGADAVVGAGAVVAKDVPSSTTVTGVPAREKAKP